MKGTYNFIVQPQDVDFQKNITFMSLGNYLLDTACMNAEANGFGLKKLQSMNSSWVLSRIAIEMNTVLTEDEHFGVQTRVEDVGRLATTRNFNILNDKNEIIGGACSNWVMFDMVTRRPVDLLSIEGLKEVAEQDSGTIEKPIRLGAIGGESVAEFTVKYSDIDINGHVNSISYVQWLCDLFSLDMYKSRRIKRLEMNYINETFWGEDIQIYYEEKQCDDFHFEIRKSDKTICKARVLWETITKK